MTRVKICGIARLEDARLALELGASEIGFILAPSPRRVPPETARDIVAALRADRALAEHRELAGFSAFRAIGVFVNEAADAMRDIVNTVGLDAAQIHGDETAEGCATFDFPWYRVLRPSSPAEARALALAGWTCPRLLADAAARGAYGGTGVVLSTEVAHAARDGARSAGKEFFLAGGLGPANIAQAILDVEPDGVDLSSGVEEAPGRKSAALLEALFAALRRADAELELRKEAARAAR